MNRREFLIALDKALYFLNPLERQDVLNDYDEHFRNEIAEGKNEFQIASDLGDPKDIAEQYRNASQPVKTAETTAAELQKPPVYPERKPPVTPFFPAGGAHSDPFAQNGHSSVPAPQSVRTDFAPAPPEAPKKTKNVFTFLGVILKAFVYTFTMIILGAVAFALVAAGWAVVVSFIAGGIAYGVTSFFIYANFGLQIGMCFAGLGLALLGLGLIYPMVKATIGLFHLAKKIIMYNVKALKELLS